MQLNISSNIKEIERELGMFHRKQVPFAVSNAMNKIAFEIQRAEKAATVQHIDRPTPFTRGGFRVTKARKNKLEASIFIADDRLEYMSALVHGGEHMRVNEPVNQKLNKYGNIPRARMSKARASPDKFFFGIPNGMTGEENSGMWERYGRGQRIRQVLRSKRKRTIKAQFPFYEIAIKVVDRRFEATLASEMHRAIATAR